MIGKNQAIDVIQEITKEKFSIGDLQLSDFWKMTPGQRDSALVQAIIKTHAWHYPRNTAYREIVDARGIGPNINEQEIPRVLRPTSQTFKSYIDILGSPFPQDSPIPFLDWMADQLSVEIPRGRFRKFKKKYRSLEELLLEFETIFSEFEFEVSTSSGTSGRSTIMVRNNNDIDKTVESFHLAFQRHLGMQADHRAIFMMPKETRIAMVHMASFSVRRVGITDERIHFTIPFPAHPDKVRIQAGRTFRDGWRGDIEKRFWHPFMNWANERYVLPKAVQQTINLLEQAEESDEKVLLFGGWVQLHAVALELQKTNRRVQLAADSLIGTGGGFKQQYPYSTQQISDDLFKVFELKGGQYIQIRDNYGMAEGNWTAMQCKTGNYHIPPWIFVVTLDENDLFQEGPDNYGLLAFYDPYAGGQLFPSFFKSADKVRLVNGSSNSDPHMICSCGEDSAYIAKDSIQRVDLVDEAGCAAQV